MKNEEIIELVLRADELFLHEQYKDALPKYTEALKYEMDAEKREYLQSQISACERPEPAAPKNEVATTSKNEVATTDEKNELSKGKQNWFKKQFGGKLNIGKDLMQMAVKRFLPKLQPIIEKNKPKATAFMRGEINFKGEPIEGDHKERLIVFQLHRDPGGDKTKDDIIVQIRKADYCKLQVARKEGKDISLEEAHSAMNFINELLNMNTDEIAKEMEKEDLM